MKMQHRVSARLGRIALVGLPACLALFAYFSQSSAHGQSPQPPYVHEFLYPEKQGDPIPLQCSSETAARADQETSSFLSKYGPVWSAFVATRDQLNSVLVSTAKGDKQTVSVVLSSPGQSVLVNAVDAVSKALDARARIRDRTWSKSMPLDGDADKLIHVRVTMLPVDHRSVDDTRRLSKSHYRTAEDWQYTPTFETAKPPPICSPDGCWAVYRQSFTDIHGMTVEHWPMAPAKAGRPLALMTTVYLTVAPTPADKTGGGVDSFVVIPADDGMVDAVFFLTVYAAASDESYLQHMAQRAAFGMGNATKEAGSKKFEDD
jgi:hypothetical protein